MSALEPAIPARPDSILEDTYAAIRHQNYYDSYPLLSGHLARLDEKLTTDKVSPEKSPSK